MDFSKLHKIKAFVFDIDGVMTDGDILITYEGNFLRKMNMKDGYALHKAKAEGYKMAAISGSTQKGVFQRLKHIGIEDVYDKCLNKIDQFNKWLAKEGLKAEEVMYMGDDCIDLECIKAAGWGVAPNDAVEEVIAIADFVTNANGGRGAVREAVTMVMKVQGKW